MANTQSTKKTKKKRDPQIAALKRRAYKLAERIRPPATIGEDGLTPEEKTRLQNLRATRSHLEKQLREVEREMRHLLDEGWRRQTEEKWRQVNEYRADLTARIAGAKTTEELKEIIKEIMTHESQRIYISRGSGLERYT